LKLKHDTLLSNFAFNCNLRHYILGSVVNSLNGKVMKKLLNQTRPEVGWCNLNPG